MLPPRLFWILLLLPGALRAQNAYPFKIATDRMLFHDQVDKQQQLLNTDTAAATGEEDPAIRLQVSDALQRQVDLLQQEIEEDSILSGQEKVKYVKSLETLLRGYRMHRGQRDFPPTIAQPLLQAFRACLQLDRKGESIEPVIREQPYGVGKIVVECFTFPTENPGVKPSRLLLIRKFLESHPDRILPELARDPYLPFADEFISKAARHDIRRLYDYAAANNALASRIRRHPDSLVRMVATIASSRSGQMYFPFLDNLLRGRITLAEIDRVKDDDLAYYKLMVRTRIDYAGRLLPPRRDTVRGMRALTDRMSAKVRQYFIREMNALHAEPNEAIRFRRLEGLSPQELYYLIVLGEEEMYTSTYLHVYKRIFRQMQVPRSDSLLLSVNGDYFRKFIKMAAGYNTLNDFLSRMDQQNATTTMKAFVIRLEETEGLEEAVDVADSYSSIMDKNPELARYIFREVQWNLDRNIATGDRRGTVIYNLLHVLFASAQSEGQWDLSRQLGIPSVYGQEFKALTDDSGRVIQQVFFYGDEDKDGQMSYANFLNMFKGSADWKIQSNEDWTTIQSVRGKPVWIFANKPLLGDDDPDARAQAKLGEYLEKRNLRPTIVIHRGHSYHLPYTLNQLAPSARIVILGSCGGYNNLNEVLTVCEDAQIISSKQIGTKAVNEPILEAINRRLLEGRDIDWISTWRELAARFGDSAARERFEDYIPPHKNLGAIFIKAYRKAMGG